MSSALAGIRLWKNSQEQWAKICRQSQLAKPSRKFGDLKSRYDGGVTGQDTLNG